MPPSARAPKREAPARDAAERPRSKREAPGFHAAERARAEKSRVHALTAARRALSSKRGNGGGAWCGGPRSTRMQPIYGARHRFAAPVRIAPRNRALLALLAALG